MLLPCPLACISSEEKPAYLVPHCVMALPPPAVFKIVSLSLTVSDVAVICLGVVFFLSLCLEFMNV